VVLEVVRHDEWDEGGFDRKPNGLRAPPPRIPGAI
jgi:hypothetical protein